MGNNYSDRFKQRAVEKALNRDKRESISSVAQEIEVSKSTLNLWIKKSDGSSKTSFSYRLEKRPQDWSEEEKLNAIIDCSNLEAENLSAYCRNRGIYSPLAKGKKCCEMGLNSGPYMLT